MPFDYNAAKDKLTEAEKARIICIFLNMEQSVVSPPPFRPYRVV